MQTHPALVQALIADRERELTARTRLPRRTRARHAAGALDSGQVTIRPARADDGAAVRRLGQLDAGSAFGARLGDLARSDDRPVLVAEDERGLIAALELPGDRVVADPFRRSAAAVELLRVRARQLRAPRRTRRRFALWERLWADHAGGSHLAVSGQDALEALRRRDDARPSSQLG